MRKYSRYTILVLFGVFFLLGMFFQKAGIVGLILKPLCDNPVEVISLYYKAKTSKPKKLSIEASPNSISEIESQRQLAIKYGRGYRTHTENSKYVSGSIILNNTNIPIKFKLKGATSKHYINKNKKYSLKIKIQDTNTIFGMKNFSISDPPVHNYLNEWIFHQLYDYCGIMYSRHDFVEVVLNGKSKGIYSLEENVGEELVENNNKKNGLFISFNPDFIWKQNNGIVITPLRKDIYNKGTIKLHDKKRILKDSLLNIQFSKAKILIERFREQKLRTRDVFCIETLAKYLSLVDLYGNRHGTGLWNLKFYFNPIKSKFEPVPFDQQEITLRYVYGDGQLIGESFFIDETLDVDKENNTFLEMLFSDRLFYAEYIKCVAEISQIEFLDRFFHEIREDLLEKTYILNKEFFVYTFKNKEILYKNQDYLRHFINPIECINAYFCNYDTLLNTLTLEVGNYYNLPVIVNEISYEDEKAVKMETAELLQAHKRNTILEYEKINIILPEEFVLKKNCLKKLRVKYSVLGLNKDVFSKLIKWTRYDESSVVEDSIQKVY